MEEYQYNYFTKLISFSFSYKILIILCSIIEIIPIVSFFMETPIIIKTYLSISKETMIIEKKILSWCEKIFLYRLFTQLREANSKKYNLLFLFIVIILFILFGLIFLIFGKKTNYYKKQEKDNFIYQTIKSFIVNFYDLLVFRCLSLFSLEILINYLCHNSSIAIAIPITLLLFIIVTMLAYYLKTFRLILKFDRNYKYVFDNNYMLYYELFFLGQKILFCFDKNIDNIEFSVILNILCIIMSVNMIYLYFYV